MCKNYKPMEEFSKDASRKDGKQNRCKVCHRNRNTDGKEKGHNTKEDGNATHDEEPSHKRSKEDDGPTDEEPKLKQCWACRNYKPMDDFYNNKSKRDGKQDKCIVCFKESRNGGKERTDRAEEDMNATQDEEPQKRSKEGDDEDGEDVVQESVQGPPRKRIKSKGDVIKFKGEDLYVFKNSRLPNYKIGCSGDPTARSNSMDASQNFYMLKVAIFEGKGYLEDTVRDMLRYCLLSREVGRGTEWHTCTLQVALSAIGQAIDNDNAQR